MTDDHGASRAARWRAAARLASRDVRRRPWRSLLVGLLVGLPVAAVAVAAIVLRTSNLTPAAEWEATYGQADTVVQSSQLPVVGEPEFTAGVRRAYPPGSEVVTYSRGPDGVVEDDGDVRMVDVTDRSLAARLLAGTYELTDGRAPRAPGEAVANRELLDAAGADVGDRVDLVLGGSVVVTGVVRDREDYRHDVVVSADPPAAHRDVLHLAHIDVPGVDGDPTNSVAPDDPGALAEVGGGVYGPFIADNGPLGEVGTAYVLGGVALLMAAIIASAAFAVGARRQLRTLGVLSAAGASPADLRRTVLLQGTVTGFVASVVAVALAIAGTAIAHPFLDEIVSRVVGPLGVHPLDMVGAVALGTLAATGAAWVPARSAGRLPTLAALAGRRPQGRVPLAVPVAGTVAVVAGIVVMGSWIRGIERPWGVGLAGAVTVALGATAIAPLLVGSAEPLASRLRRGGRVAARGLARQRLRSGAVVAAVMAPVGITILVACTTFTDGNRNRAMWESDQVAMGRLQDDEVLYTFPGTARDRVDADLGAIRAALPGAEERRLRAASRDPSAAVLSLTFRPAEPIAPEAVPVTSEWWTILVTDGDGLAALGAEPATVDALADGRVILPRSESSWGAPEGADVTPRIEGTDIRLDADDVVIDPALNDMGYLRGVGPVAFTSAEAAESWGAEVVDYAVLFTASERVTPAQQRRLGRVQGADDWVREYLTDPVAAEASTEPWLEVGAWDQEWRDDGWAIRAAAMGLSLAFTLAVVAVALALTAAESEDERRLLDAVGLPPSVRRSVSAWQAFLLPAMAVTLAVPIGLVLSAVVIVDDGRGGIQVPWPTVAGVTVLLPLASAGVTWLCSWAIGLRRRDLAGAALALD